VARARDYYSARGIVIALAAREHDADLIAMTTHGRGGLGRLVQGSIASATLERATVPLLLVRPTSRRKPAGWRSHSTSIRLRAPTALLLHRRRPCGAVPGRE
jgi:hypothetical protein